MADGEKPYRLYKGGRDEGEGADGAAPGAGGPRGAQPREAARRPRWGRRIGLAVLVLGVLLVVWVVASYLSFRSGVEDANERLPKTVDGKSRRRRTACSSRSRR